MRRLPREVWWIAGLSVVMVLIVFLLQGGSTDVDPAAAASRSSYSNERSGMRAFYLALEEAGYTPRRMFLPFAKDTMPESGSMVIASSPDDVGFGIPAPAELQTLLRWVRGGRTLLVLSDSEIIRCRHLSGPTEELLEEPEQIAASPCQPASLARMAPRITVASNVRLVLPDTASARSPAPARSERADDDDEDDPNLPTSMRRLLAGFEAGALREALRHAAPVYADREGVVAAYARVGRGRVVLLASPWSLSNEGIRRTGNFRFALNALGGPETGPVWFDEYHHGYGQSLLWALIPLPAKVAVANLLAALLLVMYARSRRLGSPVPLERGTRERSEFLGAMAGILRRGQATRLAVRTARDAAVRRLRLELGLSRDAGMKELTDAVGRANPAAAAQLRAALDRCNAAVTSAEQPTDGHAIALVRELDAAVRAARLF